MRKRLFLTILYVVLNHTVLICGPCILGPFGLYHELSLMNIFTQCNVYISQINFPNSETAVETKLQTFPSPLISLAFDVHSSIFLGTTPKNQLLIVLILIPGKSSQFLQCFPLS